ncbi:MAG: DMT family transporter [Clostridia bacterium]
MDFRKMRGTLLLATAAFIWGSTFVAQRMANFLGASTFLAARSYIGAIFIIIVSIIITKKRKKMGINTNENKLYIKYGIITGSVMYIAAVFQQISLSFTSAGKAGFLTALYIVIVPVLGLFLKKKMHKIVWLSIAISLLGTYLLSVNESFTIEIGDSYLLASAFFFAVHIVLIDRFTVKTDSIRLSAVQFVVCAIISTVVAIFTEQPQIDQVLLAWGPILYAGVFSSGIAFTLQVVAQRETPPAIAALVMSLESIFAVLTGWVVLGEVLDAKELFGCALMFIAIILAQLPDMLPKKNEIK